MCRASARFTWATLNGRQSRKNFCANDNRVLRQQSQNDVTVTEHDSIGILRERDIMSGLLTAFTIFHVLLSLIGIATGFVVNLAMLRGQRPTMLTHVFLGTTLAT